MQRIFVFAHEMCKRMIPTNPLEAICQAICTLSRSVAFAWTVIFAFPTIHPLGSTFGLSFP